MISFVVQNFYSTPFLAKTQRYNSLVISMNTKLIYTFLKLNSYTFNNLAHAPKTISFTLFLYREFFTNTFFAFFKKLYSTRMGIMTINLTKSLLHKTFNDLNTQLAFENKQESSLNHKYSLHRVNYLQPITIVSFAFHKKTYDTLMIFITLLLVSNYSAPQNSFKLYYSFILKSPNYALYPFLNLFYFKLKQF
jgi:hypothetical protein